MVPFIQVRRGFLITLQHPHPPAPFPSFGTMFPTLRLKSVWAPWRQRLCVSFLFGFPEPRRVLAQWMAYPSALVFLEPASTCFLLEVSDACFLPLHVTGQMHGWNYCCFHFCLWCYCMENLKRRQEECSCTTYNLSVPIILPVVQMSHFLC